MLPELREPVQNEHQHPSRLSDQGCITCATLRRPSELLAMKEIVAHLADSVDEQLLDVRDGKSFRRQPRERLTL